MGRPRWAQVDDVGGGVYHCISRCVRRLSLLESPQRLEWIVARLDKLVGAFAIDVCDLAAMVNHLHLMLRAHPELARAWEAEEVASRWLTIMPNMTLRRALGIDGDGPQKEEIDVACSDRALISEWRWRLSNLGWFHRLLKEPCARQWNLDDDVTGHFWAGRYRSIPCRSADSLLVQSAYVVLNPVRCGRAAELDQCEWTSLPARLRQVEAEMRAGMHGEGKALCESALLLPALPCVPGAKVRAMGDGDYSRRVAEGTWERAMRELAVEEARLLAHDAVRFAGTAIGRAARSAGQDVSAEDVSVAGGSTPHPAARHLRTVPPARPSRPAPRPAGEMSARIANRWRGTAAFPLLEGCTVEAFVEFVDDCGRVERADRKGRIATDAPRATEKLRSRARAQGAEGTSTDAAPDAPRGAASEAGAKGNDWKERLAPALRGLMTSSLAGVTAFAGMMNAMLGGASADAGAAKGPAPSAPADPTTDPTDQARPRPPP